MTGMPSINKPVYRANCDPLEPAREVILCDVILDRYTFVLAYGLFDAVIDETIMKVDLRATGNLHTTMEG